MAAKWDQVGALRLIPYESVDFQEAVGLFSIPKDLTHDRLIVNPTVVNSRCRPYANFTKLLSPGSMLTLMHLAPDQML